MVTRSSAIAEGPHDASCKLKSCQLPCNVQKLVVWQVLNKSKLWSWRVKVGRCVKNMWTHRDATDSLSLSYRCHQETDDGQVVYITCIPTTCLWRDFLSPQCRNCSRDHDHTHLGNTHSSLFPANGKQWEGRGEQVTVTPVLRTLSGPVLQLKPDVCPLSPSSRPTTKPVFLADLHVVLWSLFVTSGKLPGWSVHLYNTHLNFERGNYDANCAYYNRIFMVWQPCHLGFSDIQNFNGRTAVGGQYVSSCQIYFVKNWPNGCGDIAILQLNGLGS